ncbi:hypothetical protein [Eudoraea chungangensis]|uniref:hypothetical protein n=1 Tax=Eudoraea chungangensis TaxID=1481905 RepID=UPI0023ECD748|nr:hypothetical protein [Eudoraea chungangensis]
MQKTIKKSNFFISLCIIALFFVVISCKQESTSPNTTEKAIERASAPEQIVSLEQAQSMYGNYTERRVPIIQQYEDKYLEEKIIANQVESQQDSFVVARYIYYDYQTIKNYIAYIEQEAADAKVEISSLRFYLTNYPDKEKFDNGKPIIHPKQNSILILPAVKAGKSDYGLSINVLDNGEKVPMYLSDDLTPIDAKEIGSLDEDSKNYASMAPSINKISSKPSLFSGRNSLFLNEGGSSPPKNN